MEISSSGRGGLWGILSALGVLVMVLVAVLIAERAYQLYRAVDGQKPENTISVSADGKVKAIPDTAIISMGVFAQGATAKDAQNKAAESINKITAFVKAQGIPSEDITTTNNGLNPRYDWQNGQNKIVGYDSNQMITVKVREVNVAKGKDAAERIMAGAVDNGANQMYGSQFTIDDPDDLRQEARRLAIEEAKVKAKELAEAAGIRLGKVVSVQESGGYYPPGPLYAADAAMGRGGAVAEKAAVAPSIEPGQQEVVQTITVIFEVK